MFNINGKVWRVILCSPYSPNLKRDDGSYALGACNNYNKKIYIQKNLNGATMKKVLNHELVHAIIFSYNIHLNDKIEEIVANIGLPITIKRKI